MFCRSCRSARRFSSSASSFCCACASCRCNSSGSGSVCSSSIDSTAGCSRSNVVSACCAERSCPLASAHAPASRSNASSFSPASPCIAGNAAKKPSNSACAASFCACACLLSAKYRLGTRAGERILRKPAAKRLRALAERPRLIERLIAQKSRPDASRQRLRKRQVSGVLLFQLLLSSLERLPFGELLR